MIRMSGGVLNPAMHDPSCRFRGVPERLWMCDCGAVRMNTDVPVMPQQVAGLPRKRWRQMDGSERMGRVIGLLFAAVITGTLAATAGGLWWVAVKIWQAAT